MNLTEWSIMVQEDAGKLPKRNEDMSGCHVPLTDGITKDPIEGRIRSLEDRLLIVEEWVRYKLMPECMFCGSQCVCDGSL